MKVGEVEELVVELSRRKQRPHITSNIRDLRYRW